jgi:hypothetical protein
VSLNHEKVRLVYNERRKGLRGESVGMDLVRAVRRKMGTSEHPRAT